MLKLGVALGIVAVVLAACTSPASSPGSSSTTVPPIAFEPTAAAIPCPSFPLCFPIGDLQRDVIAPLTAAGYNCLPKDGGGSVCSTTNGQFYIELYPYSVGVELWPTTANLHRDADSSLAQITTGLRAVLPLLLPKSSGAQQFFLRQLQTAATRPHACVTLEPVGHGYGITCLGRPARATTHLANTVSGFRIFTTSRH